MASIWSISPLKGKVEVQTKDGKVYLRWVEDMVSRFEFEEEDGVLEDYLIMRCDGDTGLSSYRESEIVSLRQL